MKVLKLPLIILCSFLLGGFFVFLLLKKQIQTSNKLITNLEAVQRLDDQRIALDNDTFLKLYVCLSFVITCHVDHVLAEIKNSSVRVGSIREQKQVLLEKMKAQR